MVGILTFHWADDYGAMLQAYGLKRQLELLGEQAELVPYAPVKLTGRYWLFPLCAMFRNGKPRYYIHRYMAKCNLQMGKSFWVRKRNMRTFRRLYLTTQPPVRSVSKLSIQKYKTVFVGSDQVWNPEITVGLDDGYIGNIPVRGDCRMAAYAASLGGAVFSEGDRQKFVEYVGRFAAVSLREKSDEVRVGQILNRNVCSVLDPVLLLDRSEWEKLERPPQEQDYILVYLTEFHQPLLRCAQAISAQTGKKIISVSKLSVMKSGDADSIRGITTHSTSGPAEFLGYLQNAYCVLTNSFHGTAFSVLLEKSFLTFRDSLRSVRQEDLLVKLGLCSHLVQEVQFNEARSIWMNTDWGAVRKRLTEEREKSRVFILENI